MIFTSVKGANSEFYPKSAGITANEHDKSAVADCW
jgi:hypothetical protein